MHYTNRQYPRVERLACRCQATLAVLFSIGLAMILPAKALAEKNVLNILILGDSITQAEINRASFRYPLWKKLIDTELQFDFVGSMQTHRDKYSKGTPPQPDYKGHAFDKDHEGHFAWTANDISIGRNPNNGTGSGNLSQWVQKYDFDIVLVHLGTNDVFQKQGNAYIAGALKAVIRTLRSDNPDAIILLAQAIPATPGDAIASMNEMIPRLVEEMNSNESPVILVDQYTGFDSSKDSYDGVHPNALGEEKMAQRWFEAIQAAIQAHRPDL
jgi:lysophospholipase L1-like esterase